jgi:hypothetical protein
MSSTSDRIVIQGPGNLAFRREIHDFVKDKRQLTLFVRALGMCVDEIISIPLIFVSQHSSRPLRKIETRLFSAWVASMAYPTRPGMALKAPFNLTIPTGPLAATAPTELSSFRLGTDRTWLYMRYV